ncbi:MAG: hypothetical protein KJZ66_14175, partial [Candidatus Kuenenia stuttgartiensis]|nr:hypothetical protein [Candidatus Kuenenia stuttgartiensis]
TTMLIFDFITISPNKRLIDKPRHTPLSDNILIKTGIKSSCIWQQFYSVVDVNVETHCMRLYKILKFLKNKVNINHEGENG